MFCCSCCVFVCVNCSLLTGGTHRHRAYFDRSQVRGGRFLGLTCCSWKNVLCSIFSNEIKKKRVEQTKKLKIDPSFVSGACLWPLISRLIETQLADSLPMSRTSRRQLRIAATAAGGPQRRRPAPRIGQPVVLVVSCVVWCYSCSCCVFVCVTYSSSYRWACRCGRATGTNAGLRQEY